MKTRLKIAFRPIGCTMNDKWFIYSGPGQSFVALGDKRVYVNLVVGLKTLRTRLKKFRIFRGMYLVFTRNFFKIFERRQPRENIWYCQGKYLINFHLKNLDLIRLNLNLYEFFMYYLLTKCAGLKLFRKGIPEKN